MNGNLLFLGCAYLSHLPLYQKLVERGLSVTLEANDDEQLSAGIESFQAFEPPQTAAISERENTRILNALAQALALPEVVQAFAVNGTNHLPLIGEEFFALLKQNIDNEIRMIATMEKVNEQRPISALIVAAENSHRYRAALSFARRLGAPTVLLDTFDSLELPTQEDPTAALVDYVITPGARPVANAIRSDEPKLKLASNPFKDCMAEFQLKPKEARANLNISAEAKVVLALPGAFDIATLNYASQARQLLAFNLGLIQGLLNTDQSVELIVALHANEVEQNKSQGDELQKSVGRYLRWCKNNGLERVQVVEKCCAEHIIAADLIVSFGANPVCLAWQKPIILFVTGTTPFVSEPGIHTASNAVALSEKIQNYLKANLPKNSQEKHQSNRKLSGEDSTEEISVFLTDLAARPLKPQAHDERQTGISNQTMNQFYEIITNE